MIKHDIRNVIQSSKDDHIVFELIERFADLADSRDDLIFLIDLLEHHENSIVRHEVAAQLVEIRMRKPHLFTDMDRLVMNALVKCAVNDKSTTARHEAIEALGYVGDSKVLDVLEKLIQDKEEDIKHTAKIAVNMIKFRLETKTEPSQLWKEMLHRFTNGTNNKE
ncbi:MAG TPA: HEAT repeat domain-containing protein [Candidatus Nitrosotalea sp.]|nr:HEAT repeat domain-containing protein [Candidatus Nitrosotalea sp.]